MSNACIASEWKLPSSSSVRHEGSEYFLRSIIAEELVVFPPLPPPRRPEDKKEEEEEPFIIIEEERPFSSGRLEERERR